MKPCADSGRLAGSPGQPPPGLSRADSWALLGPPVPGSGSPDPFTRAHVGSAGTPGVAPGPIAPPSCPLDAPGLAMAPPAPQPTRTSPEGRPHPPRATPGPGETPGRHQGEAGARARGDGDTQGRAPRRPPLLRSQAPTGQFPGERTTAPRAGSPGGGSGLPGAR